jgi:hypothetical protein
MIVLHHFATGLYLAYVRILGLEHDRFKLKRESCSKTLMRDRFTFDVDRESDATSNDRALEAQASPWRMIIGCRAW